ncbi:single stranded DNA-binding protein [Acinetobacter phage SH-Ab 15599]|nr:single stranded DNA-binding protein [Acinetobacter phage SH-Ab 15599]
MAIDFSALRKSGTNNMAQLQKTLEKTERPSYDDPRIWKYEKNAKNEALAVIRFLPIPAVDMEKAEAGEVLAENLSPVVKILRHSFKTPSNKWYNKNSLATFGEEDPVREWSMPLWGDLKKLGEGHPDYERRKNELKNYIPSEDYYANILIVSDLNHPENNGTVRLFKFGRAIRKYIDQASEPPFGAAPFDPFDAFEGRNLELKLTFENRTFNGREVSVPKFDLCAWQPNATPIAESEEKIEEIWRQAHSLQEFLDRKHFPKDYDDAKAEFCKAMNFDADYNPKAPSSGTTSTTTAHQIGSVAQPSVGASAPSTATTNTVAQSAATPEAQPATANEPALGTNPQENTLAALSDLLKDA